MVMGAANVFTELHRGDKILKFLQFYIIIGIRWVAILGHSYRYLFSGWHYVLEGEGVGGSM